MLNAARAYFYQVNDEVWRKGEAGESFSLEDRAHVRLGVVTAVKLAVQAVDLVADAAGMSSAQTSCPIERCWRDVAYRLAARADEHRALRSGGPRAVRPASGLAGHLSDGGSNLSDVGEVAPKEELGARRVLGFALLDEGARALIDVAGANA